MIGGREMFEGEMGQEPPDQRSPCVNCNGDGWTVEPKCCGRFLPSGGCCDNPDPEQVQCESCSGSGFI